VHQTIDYRYVSDIQPVNTPETFRETGVGITVLFSGGDEVGTSVAYILTSWKNLVLVDVTEPVQIRSTRRADLRPAEAPPRGDPEPVIAEEGLLFSLEQPGEFTRALHERLHAYGRRISEG
jgi:hypothetical protein